MMTTNDDRKVSTGIYSHVEDASVKDLARALKAEVDIQRGGLEADDLIYMFDALHKQAAAIIKDGHTEPIENAARALIAHIDNARLAVLKGDVPLLAYNMLMAGRLADKLDVLPFEPLVIRAKGEYVSFNGEWVKVEQKQRRFLEYMSEKRDECLYALCLHVWGRPFRKDDRSRVDTLKTRVNETLDKNHVRARFRVERDRVVVDRW